MREREIIQIIQLAQGVLGCVLAIVMLTMHLIGSFVLMRCLERIPKQFRKMEPGMVWLMLVPCLNIVWIFLVYLRVAESFKAYFNAVDDDSVGDCGFGIGLAAAISLMVCMPIGLIMVIIYLMKANGLKNRIPLDAHEKNYDQAELETQ